MNFENKKNRRKIQSYTPEVLSFLLGIWSNSICPIFTFGIFPFAVTLTSQPAIITVMDETGRFSFYVIFCSLRLQETELIEVLRNILPLPFCSDFIPGAACQKCCLMSHWSFSCATFPWKSGKHFPRQNKLPVLFPGKFCVFQKNQNSLAPWEWAYFSKICSLESLPFRKLSC